MSNYCFSFKEWCKANPIKQVTEKPNCDIEDGPYLFRVDAETHMRCLKKISGKKFELVEFQNEYYVIETQNG